MHAISSYHGNRPIKPQTHKQTQPQTHRQDRLHYTAPLSLARSVITTYMLDILVHAFVTSMVDYGIAICCWPENQSLLPTSCIRVMNAATRVVSGTKYDHGLTHLVHSDLYWLDVADRVTYKLGVTVYKCLHGQAPDYLS